MANIAKVKGTLFVPNDFYKKHESFLDDYFKSNFGEEQNGFSIKFDMVNATEIGEHVCIKFECNARWTMTRCWHYLYQGYDIDKNQKFYELIRGVKFDAVYDEYEPGNEELAAWHDEFVLTEKPGKEFNSKVPYWSFDKESQLLVEYEYSCKNIIKQGFERGYNLNNPQAKRFFLDEVYEPWCKDSNVNYSPVREEFLEYVLDLVNRKECYGGYIASFFGKFSGVLDDMYEEYCFDRLMNNR